MPIIYKITSPAGKCYVGQTLYTANSRWSEHVYEAFFRKVEHSILLNRAIRKYGKDKFKVETLLIVNSDTQLTLDVLELYFILKCNAIKPHGYNIKFGAGSVCRHTEETRQKISVALKGIPKSIIMRQRLSITRKNNDNPMYIVKYRNDNCFRVAGHPNQNGHEKKFTRDTRDNNLKNAKDYLKYLNGLVQPLAKTIHDLPKYVQHYKCGYAVKLPDQRGKYFINSNWSNEKNLNNALHYYKSSATH